MGKWSINNITILSPEKKAHTGNLLINNNKIESVAKSNFDASIQINVEDGIIVPGLINAHDHLLGTYLPKVGNGPYENWLPWDNDLKSSPVYQERQQIENLDLYLLGAYRSLFSGALIVSDHIPHFVGDPFYDLLPVKAIKKFSLAHSVASFALAWGDEISVEYKRAVKNDIPFITHIAEGFDSETVRDLETIEKQGGLGDHSVFVHGIAFSENDMNKIKSAGASVVWCADSNMFMFNQTTDIQMLLDKKINVAIGTDSPMSGGLNLLYEMKFDKKLYEKLYGEELSDNQILKMVTENPAKAFNLHQNGHIKEGFNADLTIFKDKGGSPENSVVNAELEDVMLVIIDGKPVYGDEDFSELFDAMNISYQNVTLKGVKKIVIGDPVGLLRRISRAVGFKKEFEFLPIEFDF